MIFPSKFLKIYVPVLFSCAVLGPIWVMCDFETAEASSKKKFVEKAGRKAELFRGRFQDAVIVEEVLKVNREYDEKGDEKSLREIRDLDRAWVNTLGKSELILPYIKGPCADYLRKVQSQHKFVVEIFVTDRLGGVVCETDKTSDFWQGDEEKWTKSFNGGKGREVLSEPAFDGSTQTYSLHMSFPIFGKDGTTIGVAIVGVDLDEL